ncbi:hypothetical protein PGT21_023363 [Puccinia graminis f. sp. tritici]|uniref:Uncharacterized protein n=1 Tax=Puccinia graminis f. sp. tritici TaxID=56615 RepID=A0A5B0RKZ0_PUCGR|nr:hypothetical protein PGT21_023363 [Puccinia graminis f. sp. tritici]KAA1125715.1 hypothetical protein PGTUg99_004880 [Puccinia graminis f. sp. tritici]
MCFPNWDPRWTGSLWHTVGASQKSTKLGRQWTSTWRDDVTNSPVQSAIVARQPPPPPNHPTILLPDNSTKVIPHTLHPLPVN